MRWDSCTGAIAANFMDELTLVGHRGFVAVPSKNISQDQDPASAVAQVIQEMVEEYEAKNLKPIQDTDNNIEPMDENPEAQNYNDQQETEGGDP